MRTMARQRGKRLSRRFLHHYLILLLILTAALAAIGYWTLLSFTRDELDRTNRHKLELAQSAIDSQLLVLQNIAVNMSNDADLTASAVLRDTSGLSTAEALARYLYGMDILENTFVYYLNPAETRIFSPSGIYRKGFFNTIFKDLKLTVEGLDEWARTLSAPAFLSLDEGNPSPAYLLYAFPITSVGAHRNRTLFFLINTERIYKTLYGALDDAPASIRILGNDDAALFVRECPQASVGARTQYTASSKYTGLRLQMEVAPAAAFTRMHENLRRLILGIAFLAALGLGLSLILSRRVSQPIVRLAQRLCGESQQAPDRLPAYAELVNIEQSYRRLWLEKDRMATQLQTQSKILRSNLLLALLHGKVEDLEAEDLREAMGLKASHTNHMMAYILMDRLKAYRTLFTPMAQADLEEAVLEGFQSLTDLDVSVATSGFLPNKAAVLLVACGASTTREQLLSALEQLRRSIGAKTGLSLSVVCGSFFEDMADTDEQYRSLSQFAQVRIFTGWDKCLDVENAPEIMLEGEPVEPLALANACAAGDAEEADRLTRLLLRQNCTEASAIAFKRAYFQMLGVLQSIADAHPRAGRVDVDPAHEPETLAEADEYLGGLARALCACVREERLDRNASLCQAVRAYLETAYAQDACCPSQVADHFHLSQAQLNRIYKQHFGVGLATALDEVRMAKAKALLTDTAHAIKDIVAYVGYGDVNNFIRKFKKHEGMTPLVYRKKMAVSADIQALEN